MIVESQSGLRCQGLYRGKVIQHLPHGRLKVFVYGVYPEEYITHPEYLPICEQITPLWGGSFQGNGSFSYPNIGSTVWIQFANEDVNYPVAIGATLGGENAYNQYNQIKFQDEDISKKHMFTTGMSHFQMHESGKISSYVQQPYDNDVSIDFSDGDISCEISDNVMQQINNNEISHIVCQSVLDNDIHKGEISASTHFYEPFTFTSSYFLSDTQEARISNIEKETSALVYTIKNNLGDIIDNEICTLTNKEQNVYSNLNDQITILSTLDTENKFDNTETTTINGKKDIRLANTYKHDIMQMQTDAKNSSAQLSTYSFENDLINIDENHTNKHRAIHANNDTNIKQFSMFYDNNIKLLSTQKIDDAYTNSCYKIINLSGEKDDALQNISSHSDTYLYANNMMNEVIASCKNENSLNSAKDYLSNAKKNGVLNSSHIVLSAYDNNETFLKASPSESIISTQTYNENIKSDSVNTNSSIVTNINDTKQLLSTKIDILNTEITNYDNKTANTVQNALDRDKNICLKSETIINTESSLTSAPGGKSYLEFFTLNDLKHTQLSINIDNIELGNLIKHDHSLTVIDNSTPYIAQDEHLTSDNKLKIQENNSSQLLNLYNYKNQTNENYNHFVLSGDANSNALLEVNNYSATNVNNQIKTIIDKNAKVELNTVEDEVAINLKAENKITDVDCSMLMSTENKKTEIHVVDSTTDNISKITLDTQEQQLTIYADGLNGPCIITLDTESGEVTVDAAKTVNIKASNEVNIKSANTITLMSDARLNINTTNLAFSASNIEVNGNIKFNAEANFMGGVNVANGDVNVNAGGINVYAGDVNVNGYVDAYNIE